MALRKELDLVWAEWQSHVGHSVILNTVSRVISRVFVGLPLCRNPGWLDTATGCTIDTFTVAGALRDRHWLVRPLIYIFLDARKKLHCRLDTANEYLVPILETRTPTTKRDEAKPEDLLQWMTDSAEGADWQPERLVHKILFLCLASIHTSTMSACHVLFDLCQHPEYVKILRQEIEQAILDEGGLKSTAINKMRRLDSFLKESQRLNHPGSCKQYIVFPSHIQVFYSSALMEPTWLLYSILQPQSSPGSHTLWRHRTSHRNVRLHAHSRHRQRSRLLYFTEWLPALAVLRPAQCKPWRLEPPPIHQHLRELALVRSRQVLLSRSIFRGRTNQADSLRANHEIPFLLAKGTDEAAEKHLHWRAHWPG